MKNMAQFLCLLLIISFYMPLTGENSNRDNEDLSSRLFSLLYPSQLENALWGAALYDLEKQELLFSDNYQKSFMLASNQKLLTTAAALEILGPDFTYETSFYFDAESVEDSLLIGDLYIRGSGDPSFTGRFHDDKDSMDLMNKLVENIFSAHNISGLRGNIIADVSYFSQRGVDRTWENEDLSYWYAVAPDTLNFNENIITYEITVNEHGGINLYYEPDIDYLSFNLNVTTDSNNPTRIAYSRDDNKVVHIEGNVRSGESISRRVNVGNPADYFLYVFRTVAENQGIDLSGAELLIENDPEVDYDGLSLVYTHISPPMHKLVDLINKASHNMYADVVLKTLGKEVMNDGSFSSGGAVISELFDKMEIESFGMFVQDGSGLSRRNLVTPKLLTELFIVMQDSPHFEVWLSSLPQAGRDGTLRSRFRDREITGKVLAKTGFINKVRALSGYILIDEKPRYSFVLICNNYLTTTAFINRLQEEFCETVWEWHFKNEQGQ